MLRTKYCVNNYAQNLASVLAEPTEMDATFFIRDWGDDFVMPGSLPPSPLLQKADEQLVREYTKTAEEIYSKHTEAKNAIEGIEIAAKTVAEALPQVFLQEDFHLYDQSLYNTVFTVPKRGRSDALQLKNNKHIDCPVAGENIKPGQFRDYNKLLQYLQWLHELVDHRIASIVNSKPESLWQIVQEYPNLVENIASALADVNTRRKDLATIANSVANKIRTINATLEKKKQKMTLLMHLYEMQCMQGAYSHALILINNKRYTEAVRFICEKQEEMKNIYKAIPALRCYKSQLNDLKQIARKVMLVELAELTQQEFSSFKISLNAF